MSSFRYPPLPRGDGLRLLVLDPGRFSDPFRGRLVSATFASKPKYIALSYTWKDRDEAHASVRIGRSNATVVEADDGSDCIELDGHQVPISHNLALALNYLRSDKTSISLWTDQICINQDDVPERNSQVALMAFIYTRAVHVVSWLGLPEEEPDRTSAVVRASKWTSGQSQFAATERVVFSQLGQDTFPVDEDPYWRRVWIVQEVCLARSVVFVTGQYVWSEQQIMLSVLDAHAPMYKLLKARKQRFTDDMRLEALIEKFMHCGCGETRDRVYGLLGLANDVVSINTAETLPTPHPYDGDSTRRGRGTIVVDYKRPFYDIWCDVVLHMYRRAMPKLDFGKSEEERQDERRSRVVRFAGVVQKALGGKVDEEVKQPGFLQTKASIKPVSPPFIQVKAYIAGRIQSIGPTYSNFLGSHFESGRWVSSWYDHYSDENDLSKLREVEETYTGKIIDFNETDLARISSFENHAVAWSPLRDFSPEDYKPALGCLPLGEPARFVGTEHCMGLAPHGAEVGDLVLRFWDCDAAIVMRLRSDGLHDYLTGEDSDGISRVLMDEEDSGLPPEQAGLYELVGRADIAEPHVRKEGLGDARAKDRLKVDRERMTTTARYVWMDLATLQKISVAIKT
ncbi:uncharacterized protein E0L32_012081 [Thyridium curvatum]|uniref:Heterokaryon incompatibility domain-containing protein n=1 Tax=Thyridium curvatum TaxID=1093900 RepID=A0A507BE84_9PEZI|nr:uncharacterized protein E0L32_012081 [Thyridium curvatum]TPX17636.1 hypothetical protein E0L32_012081 [Thyridium curvatum]